ncbi:Transferrin receptor-like, ESAG6-like [Trypanosoma congolense IL3000]|uniref:Transferrin receptor-like, ESAG6-like n=1 Tax=Trypanosoma congolense (strain IL3000) TaxID=1068625 RepID=F9W9T9_TRYCI|nr:Transferrin receptor-like, ESAG6-like [Trypanosoma congolense IL3000]
MMAGEVRLVFQLLAVVFLLCSEFTWGNKRQAIPTEVGESICSLSRKLKRVATWVVVQIAALKKSRDEYASKFLDWKLHFQGSSECEVNESILDEIWVTLENVNEEIKTLPAKAIRSGALAARSAGRLDEFITVFANARKTGSVFVATEPKTSNYCLGSGGYQAKRRDLFDCFPTGGKVEMGEANLAKIPETMTDLSEPNLTAVIENINHSSVAEHINRKYVIDAKAGCNLIKGGAEGIVGGINGPLWWGGGIFTIGKGFDGSLGVKDKFGPGEITNAKGSDSNKAFWTASPHTIPHLKKTLAAFQAFKDAAATITQKFSEIEKIEKKIEPCLSNETMEDRPTQSCFKNAVKLNAELQAANALLARYHKEKGPLPSGSPSPHAQGVMHLLHLISFLL